MKIDGQGGVMETKSSSGAKLICMKIEIGEGRKMKKGAKWRPLHLQFELDTHIDVRPLLQFGVWVFKRTEDCNRQNNPSVNLCHTFSPVSSPD